MVRSRPYVPAEPTLGWEQLRAATRPLRGHPFSADAVTWTHLGRGPLHLAARVLGLEGREVLVPSYHHGIEVDALLAAGAHPAFYAVGTRRTVDVEDLERRIGPRTRALVLTHFGGFPGPTRQMRALADRHGLTLIEDCAQALLSMNGECPVGTGDAAVFSLRKTLPVPHGGALVFNGARAYQLPPLERPAAGPTLRGLWARALLRGDFRPPGQGGALRRLGRWFSRSFPSGRPRSDEQARRRRTQLELGVSALVARIVRAHELARVVSGGGVTSSTCSARCEEWRRRWSASCPRGCARSSIRSGCPTRTRRWPGSGSTTWRPAPPGPASTPGVTAPSSPRLRQHVLELPCHQDLGPEHVAHVARAAQGALGRDRTHRSRAAEG